MVVGVAALWKMPLGYFLSAGLSAEVLKNLLVEAICCITECGLEVVAVVCDCLAANVAMAKLLGCHVHKHTFANLKTFFPHPSKEDDVIFFLFDACHALKLLRNLLGDKGVLLSATYGTVLWKHIKALQELQERDGLRAANKLTKAHIAYYQQVSAFDLLNSSNPVAAGFKAPLRPSTFAHQREVMEAAGQQLMELRLGNERLVAQDGRRMSVIAMALTLKSVSLLAAKLFGANLCNLFGKRGDCCHHATRGEQTVRDVVAEVIVRAGVRKWFHFPWTPDEKGAFKKVSSAAGVIGCVDGSVAVIIAPKGDHHKAASYYCKKHYADIVMLQHLQTARKLHAMLRVVQCGFKPVEGLDDYFRPSLLRKRRRLLDNNHVFGVREVDETAISAKCLSEQSKHAYEVHLNTLKEMARSEADLISIEAEEEARRVSQLEKVTRLLPAPCKALHVPQMSGTYPKQHVAAKDYVQLMTQEQKEFYQRHIVCESPSDLCRATMGQSSCVRWHKEKKFRISSTTSHTILHARRSPEEVARAILNSRPFSTEATAYGLRTEPQARMEFEHLLGVEVVEMGLLIHPDQPWLCGSPDGMFCLSGETCLLEIKCPHKFKEEDMFTSSGEIILDYILGTGCNRRLKRTHKYFTQVTEATYQCHGS
ncbi:hypothetical protein MTO96_009318 [Rhipicephalus appendiculatus]